MVRKSQYDLMMEELKVKGKVRDVPPEVRAKIIEGLRRDLEEYRAELKPRYYTSEQDIMIPILNV